MITVAPSQFKVTQRPSLAPVATTTSGGQSGASFSLQTGIEAVGTATLHGAAGDIGTGWALGFLQAQWIETNWAAYRGRTEKDGSAFLQRARPPARPHQACFDCLTAGAPFYGTGASPATAIPVTGGPALPFVASLPAKPTFPLTLSVIHRDFPGDFFAYTRTNGTTGQMNFLFECQLEFAFCISLVLRGPGQLHFLQNLYWNVNWQSSFTLPPAAGSPVARSVPGGNSANVGHVIAGRPTDARFVGVLTTPQAQNCNQIAAAEESKPNVRETTGWPLFDVRR